MTQSYFSLGSHFGADLHPNRTNAIRKGIHISIQTNTDFRCRRDAKMMPGNQQRYLLNLSWFGWFARNHCFTIVRPFFFWGCKVPEFLCKLWRIQSKTRSKQMMEHSRTSKPKRSPIGSHKSSVFKQKRRMHPKINAKKGRRKDWRPQSTKVARSHFSRPARMGLGDGPVISGLKTN